MLYYVDSTFPDTNFLPPVTFLIHLSLLISISIHLSSSPPPPEPSDVPQPRGRLGDPRCPQNHHGAAQTGEEAAGRRLLKGGEGKVSAHPEPLRQGHHPPARQPHASAGTGPPHTGPLQYFTPRTHTGWRWRRRAEGEV